MKRYALAVVGAVLPSVAAAQIVPPSQTEQATINANLAAAQQLVDATKNANHGTVASLSIARPVYLSPNYEASMFSAASLARWARACSPVITLNYEVIAGRIRLPTNEVKIKWQCPAGSVPSGETTVEFDGSKVAFVRTVVSDLLSRIVVVPERR